MSKAADGKLTVLGGVDVCQSTDCLCFSVLLYHNQHRLIFTTVSYNNCTRQMGFIDYGSMLAKQAERGHSGVFKP